MEIQSFILGMGTVLVIAFTIVGVVAFIKVIGVKKRLEEIISNTDVHFSNLEKDVDRKIDGVYVSIDGENRTIDSRFDKLHDKFSKEIETLKHYITK